MIRRIVITGSPGSGKTPILHELASMGYAVVHEPARRVLAEQRTTGGDGVPDRDPAAFCRLMLSTALGDYDAATAPMTFFDRAIPDLIGYAGLFGLDASDAEEAARTHRYDDVVFVTPTWPEIYTTDDERTMSLEMADAFGARVAEIYRSCGYTNVEVPQDTPSARAAFIARTCGL